MIDNIKAFFMLYVNPAGGFGRILDRGRLWMAALGAVAVGFVLHFSDIPIRGFAPPISRFISYAPGAWLIPLIILAVVIVPSILLLRAMFGHGSFTVLLNTDYVPLLMCSLTAWAAAYLPLVILRWIGFEWAENPLLYLAFNAYAMVLTAFAVRTIYNAGFVSSLGITLIAWVAGAASAYLFALIGGMLYFLASPLVLFYLWIVFGSNLRSLGEAMQSRQHFQRQLEISTANPHDADAHYQLGLIHQRRRQYSDAISRFERAVKIDPTMADAHLQLGVIARGQGRLEDAMGHLKTAASLDDRLAQNDVWRELGAAYYASGRFEDARAALEKFTDRREYDPEGLYWYGKTLKELGREAEARHMFERAIEAARTMPAHRRSQVRVWAGRAKSEL